MASCDALRVIPEEVFVDHVLSRLSVSDVFVLSRVDRRMRVLLVGSGVREGERILPRVSDFVNSIARLCWARSTGCRWDELCKRIAFGGNVDVMRWARGQDPPCPLDADTWCNAAKGGQLEMLQWAQEQDPPCVWKSCHICAYAAEGGYLDVLQWARAQEPPCPWDKRTCGFAARGGHLDVLKWAREHHCPWDEKTCCVAAREGHLEVLKWARDQDPPCPWDWRTCRFAAMGGHKETFLWALMHGCDAGDEHEIEIIEIISDAGSDEEDEDEHEIALVDLTSDTEDGENE